jgi:Tfp pilus assembly protein PilO
MGIGKWSGFRVQPVAVSEAVRQALFTLALFNIVAWTNEQQMAVLQLVSAVMAVLTYNSVTSQATLETAGSSQAAVVAEAEKKKAEAAGAEPPAPPPQL